jgi:uncharacterized membrane protein
MKEAKRILKALAYSAAIGLASATGSAKAAEYEIIKLAPDDPNCNYSEVFSINDEGKVIGVYGKKNRDIIWEKSFLYDNGEFRNLNLHLNNYSSINNWGDILDKNIIYGPNDIINIGFTGSDMNNKKEVAGSKYFYRDGEVIRIPGAYRAMALNDKSQVVGELLEDTYPNRHFGFIWEDGVTTQIEDLWRASDINNKGVIVGDYFIGGHLEPCLWNNGERVTFGNSGAAVAINDLDQIVGISSNRAFIYQDGEMAYLNNLIPVDSGWGKLYIAIDINNKGQIIGNMGYLIEEDYYYAFLANPISKPKTLKADLNDDGIVNGKDLAELGNQWLEREDWYEE